MHFPMTAPKIFDFHLSKQIDWIVILWFNDFQLHKHNKYLNRSIQRFQFKFHEARKPFILTFCMFFAAFSIELKLAELWLKKSTSRKMVINSKQCSFWVVHFSQVFCVFFSLSLYLHVSICLSFAFRIANSWFIF